MGSFFGSNVTVFTFLPMLGIGMPVDIRMLYRRSLHIHIGMPAPTGMSSVSALQAGGVHHGRGILVCMVIGKLGNGFFLCEAAECTGECHHARSILCCLFRNHALAEGMGLGIQSNIAFIAAQRPMHILIILDLTCFACAVTAFAAVVVFPLCAFRAYAMFTAQIQCRFCAARLAQLAIRTDGNAVFALDAGFTDGCTIPAILAAVNADVFHTVTAIIAVTAHDIGAVDADAAIWAELVYTAGALAASFANIFCAVGTNDTAVLAHRHTIATLITVLTEDIPCAFTADVTGGTEFIRAIGALFIAIRTKVRTVFAALAAGTYQSAIRAQTAVYAEAVRTGTINALAAFHAHLSVRAFAALFAAFRTDLRTVGAALTAAKADVIHTVFTNRAGIAEIAVAAGAIAAGAAFRTKLVSSAVGAFFAAIFTYVGTVGAACTAARANSIHAEFTERAGIAEVIITAYTVTAGAAFRAQLIRRTVGALFVALLTDHFCALIAAVATGT